MTKSKFDGFINRYSLGGEIESVLIKSDSKSLNVSFISDDKTLLGNTTVYDVNFPEGDFGIYTTSLLKQFLSVLDENISVSTSVGSLQFSDENIKVNYMLAAESVIPNVPSIKKMPDFNVEIKLDTDFITKFIRSKNAIGNDSDSFTFLSKNGKSEIILGYSTQNTNRISITVDANVSGDVEPISFSSKYLKQIFSVRRESNVPGMKISSSNSAVMKISSEGLLHILFSDNIYKSEYFLVELK
jgi:hypothetical protein